MHHIKGSSPYYKSLELGGGDGRKLHKIAQKKRGKNRAKKKTKMLAALLEALKTAIFSF